MLIMVLYSIFFCIEEVIYRNLVSESIDDYIKAQGLNNEEVLTDTGLKNEGSYGFKRTIIYKNSPDMEFIYSSGPKEYNDFKLFVPFYNLITYKYRIENKEFAYNGVYLSWHYLKDSDDPYAEIDYEKIRSFEVGELDIFGNLLKEIPWIEKKE